MPSASPLLLFYPTSPVHVRDMRQVAGKLVGWRVQAVTYESLADIAPGIARALDEHGIAAVIAGDDHALDASLPDETSVLVLGAVFEPFALELFAWAKLRSIPVAAIEEVAQLGLNDNDISNYDAPFDRLFVASADELERFLALGYPREMLRTSGLPAYERIAPPSAAEEAAALEGLNIRDGRKPIVYTTSPLRSRRAIHNKDTASFRHAMLQALAQAAEATKRRVVVKLHPNEDPATERAFIAQRIPDAIVIGREVAMDTLFAAAAVVVNRGNSQTCLEAVLRGIPVVVAACGLRSLFHDSGTARIVDSTNALTEAVARAIADGPRAAPDFRRRHCRLPDGGVDSFIADELRALAGQRIPATPLAWRWLVRSMLFMGRHARALALLRHAPVGGPWADCVRLGLDAHLAGQRESAMGHWQRCREIDPEWFFPDFELAHGCQAAGLNESAFSHAHRAIALHPPFHGLWHELPMRVVIMAALRALGRDIEAAAELAALDRRGLVDVAPELLIEKSALATRRVECRPDAIEAVECALELLARIPIDPVLDDTLRERALAQLRAVAARAEQTRNHAVVAACHICLAQYRPDDVWVRFARARAALGNGSITGALRGLARITAIPDAPRELCVRVLPPEAVARLLPLWPGKPEAGSRPWKLILRTTSWCLHILRASGGRDWPHALAFTILVLLFVPRHFLHRLLARKPVIP
ncbi:MAG: hypothetical protein HZA62_02230 [Rhodocyclales bacterium]|nr:hypothetical protein [Rhodocyclales bacterium]